jgi:hypothetical protein
MTIAEADVGVQFDKNGNAPTPVMKTIRPPEEPYTSGESLGVTQGIAPKL